MKKRFVYLMASVAMAAFSFSAPVSAQRTTDVIDRGVIAVPSTEGGYLVQWRKFGEEYYDTQYNLYRDGVKVNEKPLDKTNLVDKSGSAASKYTVSAIVRGVEQPQSKVGMVWENGYFDIKMASRLDRAGKDMTSDLEPNDVSVADVNGDGVVEFLVKRKCVSDALDLFLSSNKTRYDQLDVYTIDGKLLWYIDCGPNMVSGSSVEVNIVGYDWDMDGKAEVLLRGADNMVIHKANGETVTVGDPTVNTRHTISRQANLTYTNTGAEYLLYLNGETGEPYVIMDYPLERGDANDWGDGYGHRSSKYFFGAPFLDGKKASIFLARGIYTKHAMIAYDVDPATHKLTERWRWNSPGGAWHGQGYHNYGIADVDWDGRDEIVYGSMVIDDNGKGLSTSGLGHGDAQHCSDFDPFRHGQEIFACNEDQPANNYRDATTSKIYYRVTGGGDDGRCMAGNFSNDVFGALGFSSRQSNINLCSAMPDPYATGGVDVNFRLYWDGDLLEESFNYDGFDDRPRYGVRPRAHKYSATGEGTGWRNLQMTKGNYECVGVKTCNDTKGTPSVSADIFGDWREELVMPTIDNTALRIFATPYPTEHSIYTLWHDHQYRQGMVWQMCGYNQPVHTSFFLGEREKITVAPPPLTTTGREVIAKGGSLSAAINDKHALISEVGDATFTLNEDIEPYILTVNTPSWVQGNTDNKKIVYDAFTHTVTGTGSLTGAARLVKQGDGTLALPANKFTHTGKTEVWAGAIEFDGEFESSPVWLNRFAMLISNGGKFHGPVTANFGAQVDIAGEDNLGEVTIDDLTLSYGSELVIDLYNTDADGPKADILKAKVLNLDSLVDDRAYINKLPVLKVIPHLEGNEVAQRPGEYLIGEVETIKGNLGSLTVEGLPGMDAQLKHADGKLYLTVPALREHKTLYFRGFVSNIWDNFTENFIDESGQKDIFVLGDDVVFDDESTVTDVILGSTVVPRKVIFRNATKRYKINIDSEVNPNACIASVTQFPTTIEKYGAANTQIQNVNKMVGTITIYEGSLVPGSLAYSKGLETGSFGAMSNRIVIKNGGSLSISGAINTSHPVTIEDGGVINTYAGASLTLEKGITATSAVNWTKKGTGTLNLAHEANGGILHIQEGRVVGGEAGNVLTTPSTVYIEGGTLEDLCNIYSYSTSAQNVIVPAGKKGEWYLDNRCGYTGTLTGAGAVTVYSRGPRTDMNGDWSKFEGAIALRDAKVGNYDPYLNWKNSYGLPKATLTLNSALANGGNTVQVGNLKGSVTMYEGGKWIVGALNNEITYTGTISGGALEKVGDGIWTMKTLQQGVKESTDVRVKGGILNLMAENKTANKKENRFFGENKVSVFRGGTLTGVARVAEIQAEEGGIVAPGDAEIEEMSKALYSSVCTILPGGVLSLNIRIFGNGNTSRSYMVVDGKLTLQGVLEVTMSKTCKPAAGDSIVLWTAEKFSKTATTELKLPKLSNGLEWDTKDLFNPTGILRVKAAGDNAIGDVVFSDPEAAVTANVYSINGSMVGQISTTVGEIEKTVNGMNLAKGIYVVAYTTADGRKSDSVKVLKK